MYGMAYWLWCESGCIAIDCAEQHLRSCNMPISSGNLVFCSPSYSFSVHVGLKSECCVTSHPPKWQASAEEYPPSLHPAQHKMWRQTRNLDEKHLKINEMFTSNDNIKSNKMFGWNIYLSNKRQWTGNIGMERGGGVPCGGDGRGVIEWIRACARSLRCQ